MGNMSEDVKLARQGDAEAFSRLYATVYKDLYHIALYSLRNSEDASDAVSDTVLDAFTSIKKLRDPEKFRGWIMKILSSKIKRKQREYFSAAEEEQEGSEMFSFESVELKEALGHIDSESRLMLSMSVLGGYSSDDIARICNMKAGTVRSKLARIKEELRLELV